MTATRATVHPEGNHPAGIKKPDGLATTTPPAGVNLPLVQKAAARTADGEATVNNFPVHSSNIFTSASAEVKIVIGVSGNFRHHSSFIINHAHG